MNRTGSMQDTRMQDVDRHGGNAMTDLEAWLGNGLALILSALAIASGVIGLLVSFGYINDSVDSFENGMVWLIGGVILGICANAFRREHHIVDDKDRYR
jgi:hypothetical protein